MTDRNALLEAALDSRPDGIALLGLDGEVVFWNRAAEEITGFPGFEVLRQPVPAPLNSLLLEFTLPIDFAPSSVQPPARLSIVQTRHKLGHSIQAMMRRVTLCDALGAPIGTAVVFHPAESLDALPHGDSDDTPTEDLQASQADLEERLQAEFDDFARGGPPFGVLWISVDQAQELRKTHGVAACHAMLDKVRHALVQGLRPAEQLGRWGDNEFLIVAHERSAGMLAAHAHNLAGLARTTDFRWWGDRISISVSIGGAQSLNAPGESLVQLLERARTAVGASLQAGGNRAAIAPERSACFPS